MEIWKDILECEGYQISNYGRVRITSKLIIRKPSRCSKWGHLQFKVTKKRVIVFKELVHRLVARHFIPNPLNLPVVNHIDNNPRNNHVDNLEWCTQSHNQLHSVKTGNSFNRLGSGCHKAKINEQDAKNVFELSKYMRIKDVVIMTGFTPSIVHKIKNGYSWNHITGMPRKRYSDKNIKFKAA